MQNLKEYKMGNSNMTFFNAANVLLLIEIGDDLQTCCINVNHG